MTRRVISGAPFVGASGRAPGRTERRGNGLYPTPAEASRPFLAIERERIRGIVGRHGLVAEPASGADDLVREIEAAGFKVAASDIDPRGRGRRQDFLAMTRRPARAIVTNPPFGLAVEFIRRAAALEVGYLALLLKATWFNTQAGLAVRDWWRPTSRYDLTWRVDFLLGGKGRSFLDLSWFVWVGPPSPYRPLPTWDLIERPR